MSTCSSNNFSSSVSTTSISRSSMSSSSYSSTFTSRSAVSSDFRNSVTSRSTTQSSSSGVQSGERRSLSVANMGSGVIRSSRTDETLSHGGTRSTVNSRIFGSEGGKPSSLREASQNSRVPSNSIRTSDTSVSTSRSVPRTSFSRPSTSGSSWTKPTAANSSSSKPSASNPSLSKSHKPNVAAARSKAPSQKAPSQKAPKSTVKPTTARTKTGARSGEARLSLTRGQTPKTASGEATSRRPKSEPRDDAAKYRLSKSAAEKGKDSEDHGGLDEQDERDATVLHGRTRRKGDRAVTSIYVSEICCSCSSRDT